jgi:hypothetical protein
MPLAAPIASRAVGWHAENGDPDLQAYWDGERWIARMRWDGTAWVNADATSN